MCDLETWVILQAETQISTSERSTTPLIFSFVIISFQLVERLQNGSGLQLFGHVTG